MQAGNAHYNKADDLPQSIPVFPLAAALLLPGGRLPLNIFEPRYLQMVDDALGRDRLIGMVQPRLDGGLKANGEPELCQVGCLGRLTSFAETGDGRYLISLQGIVRFRVLEELGGRCAYRRCRVAPFASDFGEDEDEAAAVDRKALLKTFKAYLDANGLEADWDSIRKAENATLVNALSMMSPYGASEKQALLEAPDLKTRAETLVAITEMLLARNSDETGSSLQ
ncbi:LON peptidase substrate-binding domain-containing protein [Nitratireductor mangrovi]|uniref:LON peptidase substrate-binding domain-containing protein n=1 Tax=Nitratireductor mangrovi TaxID=2599600 RepID=A0A5B8L2A4_9HYPH|nr:LON peptidase substrate-binding domain-containing protein [Nitratireductor mangrovi]QDZ01830.1 LON peptidase substrate-binding domain-containing protein [Nitratireductor mangrovi]